MWKWLICHEIHISGGISVYYRSKSDGIILLTVTMMNVSYDKKFSIQPFFVFPTLIPLSEVATIFSSSCDIDSATYVYLI
jgi:hypothetical protein